jgi:hypothetical protein
MQFNLVGVASQKRIAPEIYAKPALPTSKSKLLELLSLRKKHYETELFDYEGKGLKLELVLFALVYFQN